MDYPFYYKGKLSGTLSVAESGIYTLFRLDAEKIDKKMLRVSVYGEGKESCLGLAEVRGGKIYFEKKLSRNAMRELPRKIEYAAETGEKAAEKIQKKEEEKETGLVWEKRPDGSLISNDGKSNIVALPAELRGKTGKDKIKVIDGCSYMLFRY